MTGATVRLVTIDDTGDEVSTIDSTLTDGSGRFRFSMDPDSNASLIAVADLPEGALRGFYAGRSSDIPIHPLSETLVSLVVDITSSHGGRTLSDFTAGELREIADLLFAWDFSSTGFGDAEALRSVARVAAGRTIALASGGTFSAQSTGDLEGTPATSPVTFAQDLEICGVGQLIRLLEGGSFRFDVEADGTICGGTHPELPAIFSDKAFTLNFPGEVFFGFGGSSFPLPLSPTASLVNDRTISLGPYPLVKPSSIEPGPWEEDPLTVARKVHVSPSGDMIRYLEIFTNGGEENRALDITVQSYLTTANGSKLLTFDGDGEAPNATDRFLAAYDDSENRPTAGFVFQDGLGAKPLTAILAPQLAGGQPNEVRYVWNDLVVPAGETRTLLHFGHLTTSRLPDDVHSTLTALAESPDMEGLSRTELAGLLNFTPSRGTVQGDAGAVIGLASVTGVNPRTAESLTLSARRDGSFALPLDAESGDTILLTASDGLDVALTVP